MGCWDEKDRVKMLSRSWAASFWREEEENKGRHVILIKVSADTYVYYISNIIRSGKRKLGREARLEGKMKRNI